MAAETTLATWDDASISAAIEEVAKAELGARVVIAPFCRTKSLSGTGSHVWQVPKITALSTGVAAVAEANNLANEAISTGNAQITASEVGGMSSITDKLRVGTVLSEDIVVLAGQVWGRNMARYIDATIAALFTAFNGGTGIGTTTVDMTEIDFQTAIYTLEVANAVGPKVCILHPRQIADLRQDMFLNAVTTSGGMPGHVSTLNHNEFGFPEDEGFWTTLYGVPIYSSTSCPTANAGADRSGAMFVVNSALGIAYHWLPRVELQRDASWRTTEVVITADIGFGEIEDAEGVPIETDA